MRIAYLTQVFPHPTRADLALPTEMTEAMAKQGHQVLVVAASDREYSYHIYRDNITVIQLRSFRCSLFVGKQPIVLPFPIILQSLYKFHPDIIYMDMANSMNWIGHVYSFFSHVPIRSTPQQQIEITKQN